MEPLLLDASGPNMPIEATKGKMSREGIWRLTFCIGPVIEGHYSFTGSMIRVVDEVV